MVGGLLTCLLIVGATRRLAALAAFAVTAGIILTLIVQSWFQFLQGHFWLNALAIALSIVATSAFVVGCDSLIGRVGMVFGAVFTLLVANPLSAASLPWQFIRAPTAERGRGVTNGTD